DEVIASGIAGAAGAWLLWNMAPVVMGWMGWSLSGLGASSWVAGYMGPVVFGALYMGVQVFGTLATRGLDATGNQAAGALSFLIKFAMSPITTTAGLVIGFARTGFGLWGNVDWFNHGVIVFQTDETSGFDGAMTWGATVQWQGGNLSGARIQHEMYHSRQFVYAGDGFGLTWATVGALWGLVESWISKGSPDEACLFGASGGSDQIGNPLENRAHQIFHGGTC
ncbi:MAG TPA: hypothetical protein VFA92_09345, partial [Candidatus Binatia bacterium]|nr:hypothetical protein [Candidatus Binatia bacterium]